MELLLTAILLGAVVIVIAGPLRPGRQPQPGGPSARRAIEIAKDAKYREILDAELDFQTGKLSEPDYREVDRQLRRAPLDREGGSDHDRAEVERTHGCRVDDDERERRAVVGAGEPKEQAR